MSKSGASTMSSHMEGVLKAMLVSLLHTVLETVSGEQYGTVNTASAHTSIVVRAPDSTAEQYKTGANHRSVEMRFQEVGADQGIDHGVDSIIVLLDRSDCSVILVLQFRKSLKLNHVLNLLRVLRVHMLLQLQP